jgi:hypothetical protein
MNAESTAESQNWEDDYGMAGKFFCYPVFYHSYKSQNKKDDYARTREGNKDVWDKSYDRDIQCFIVRGQRLAMNPTGTKEEVLYPSSSSSSFF